MEAHVPPMEKLRLSSYVRKGKSFWRCLFTFSSMEELHLFMEELHLTQTEENPAAALAELPVRHHNDNTPQLKLT